MVHREGDEPPAPEEPSLAVRVLQRVTGKKFDRLHRETIDTMVTKIKGEAIATLAIQAAKAAGPMGILFLLPVKAKMMYSQAKEEARKKLEMIDLTSIVKTATGIFDRIRELGFTVGPAEVEAIKEFLGIKQLEETIEAFEKLEQHADHQLAALEAMRPELERMDEPERERRAGELLENLKREYDQIAEGVLQVAVATTSTAEAYVQKYLSPAQRAEGEGGSVGAAAQTASEAVHAVLVDEQRREGAAGEGKEPEGGNGRKEPVEAVLQADQFAPERLAGEVLQEVPTVAMVNVYLALNKKSMDSAFQDFTLEVGSDDMRYVDHVTTMKDRILERMRSAQPAELQRKSWLDYGKEEKLIKPDAVLAAGDQAYMRAAQALLGDPAFQKVKIDREGIHRLQEQLQRRAHSPEAQLAAGGLLRLTLNVALIDFLKNLAAQATRQRPGTNIRPAQSRDHANHTVAAMLKQLQ
ncbi:MAG: hypothetical protein Q7R81_07700 [Candidatus Peregrinibacteria bacterium]|nr:hypothetical protein [Candidatus Peregrinibacteria bacterium]